MLLSLQKRGCSAKEIGNIHIFRGICSHVSGFDNSKRSPLLHKELHILTGAETRQLFCRMFVMLNMFKELFYPTLNGITASVSFVSLT